MGADGQGEGKDGTGRGSGSKAASLPEYPFMLLRAGGSKGSSVRRQVWESGSCCRLTSEGSKAPQGGLFPVPLLMHREDVPYFQIFLRHPLQRRTCKWSTDAPMGEATLRFHSEICDVEALAILVSEGVGARPLRDTDPQTGVKGSRPARLRESYLLVFPRPSAQLPRNSAILA